MPSVALRGDRRPPVSHMLTTNRRAKRIDRHGRVMHNIGMKTTMNLDDDLVREAMATHERKTKTAVLELGLQDLINADPRRRLSEAFGSQPGVLPVTRRRAAQDPR